jgi:hypothetical protein
MIGIELHDCISIGNGLVRISGYRTHVNVIGKKLRCFVGGHLKLLHFGVRLLVAALKALTSQRTP